MKNYTKKKNDLENKRELEKRRISTRRTSRHTSKNGGKPMIISDVELSIAIEAAVDANHRRAKLRAQLYS